MKGKSLTNEKSKDLIAGGCIAAALIGLVLGIIFPQQIGGSFSAGTIISFAAFLLSLSSAKDHGSNWFAVTAFLFSFIAMAVTIAASSLM